MKKKILFLIIICLVFGGVVWFNKTAVGDYFFEVSKPNLPKEELPKAQAQVKEKVVEPVVVVSVPEKIVAPEPEINILSEVNLPVPFLVQAPKGIWDLPYQEACEEASLIMANAFVTDSPLPEDSWSAELADKEILKVVAWENKNLGFYEDTTVEQTIKIAKDYFGIKNIELVENPTAEDFKKFLSEGKIIIVPAYGKALGNPYFSGDGPLYHMVVVKGFTKDNEFITNDPGTKRGRNFVYKTDVLFNAIHDWNNGDVQNGAKRVIVIGK